MTWDWASFLIGLLVGTVGTVIATGLLFAAMADRYR